MGLAIVSNGTRSSRTEFSNGKVPTLSVNGKRQRFRPFTWKWSVRQNLDQERTNQLKTPNGILQRKISDLVSKWKTPTVSAVYMEMVRMAKSRPRKNRSAERLDLLSQIFPKTQQ